MSIIKGFPTQKKGLSAPESLDAETFKVKEQYMTLQDMGSDRVGADMLPKAIFPVLTDTLDAASDDRTLVFSVPHTARKGDVIRFTSGALINVEVGVLDIVDATTLVLSTKLDASAAGLDVIAMRYLTLTVDSSGSLVTTAGPVQFVRDTVNTLVEEDTATPANNRALPSHGFFTLDGEQVPIVEDTGTPANNTPLPVKITSTSGDINITAGDLNVQTSASGANFDSMRIGDGTNLMAINASLQAEVHDADALTELQSLVAAQRLDVVDLVDGDILLAGTIPGSAGGYLTIVSSLAANVLKIQSVEDIGEFIGLYSDPSGTPVLECILPLAGGEVELNLPITTELGLRNMKTAAIDIAVINSAFAINFLG